MYKGALFSGATYTGQLYGREVVEETPDPSPWTRVPRDTQTWTPL